MKFKKMTTAVLFCFKLIYVLDVQYQVACIGTWDFLQNMYLPEAKTVAVSTSVRGHRQMKKSKLSALSATLHETHRQKYG